MSGIFYNKSELETLAMYAYQEGFNDSKEFETINPEALETSVEWVTEQFIDRKLSNQLNTIPESYKDELGRFLVATAARKITLERLEVVFWAEFNSLFRNNMKDQALELARGLPECSLRMKAIGICQQ